MKHIAIIRSYRASVINPDRQDNMDISNNQKRHEYDRE